MTSPPDESAPPQSAEDTEPAAEAEPAPAPRLQLSEPLPPVTQTDAALAEVVSAVAAGSGPVALDAERASGYRYSQRAYLVQLRRAGVGTVLVDPVPFDDLVDLDTAIGDAEWILHAASQDLVCLAEVGMVPRRLFDTELAGRLLNLPRVGLAALVEELLGRSLAKEHSAVDWSTRPLPEPWLQYAALDVEPLLELRDVLVERLDAAGKLGWAREEFDALLTFTGPGVRLEPWRRTTGIQTVRGRRALGTVRSLWQRRDAIAAHRDVAPGRVLADAAIVQLASNPPANRSALRESRPMRGRGARRHLDDWWEAIEEAAAVPEEELPAVRAPQTGPPPPRAWADRNPPAAVRLAASREAVNALAALHELPVENLLTPSILRALAWDPPPGAVESVDVDAVADRLRADGARAWQIGLTADPIAQALAAGGSS
jgi:ribonuclease D